VKLLSIRPDRFSLLSFGLVLFLAFFAQSNHTLFSSEDTPGHLGFGLVLISYCAFLSAWANRFPRFTHLIFALSLTAYLYLIWPHMFFDDAGFILRYLDQLKKGYWFEFNAGEGPVYGISGFLHGLYASILVKTGMTAERALHVSNVTGLWLCLIFLRGIFYGLLRNHFLSYLSSAASVLLSKTFCDVLFTGMETPLHVSFILGTAYFFVSRQIGWFFFFGAVSVISKLDAVPVIGMLFLLFAVSEWQKGRWKELVDNDKLKAYSRFFIPLGIWIAFAFFFFGSPFPQSAKAKVLYHSGANTHWFPFMEGFLSDIYKKPLLILFSVLFAIHVLLIRRTSGRALTHFWIFGWMFFAIMGLYYFYNPNERMLWYYALPDLLLVGQCALSAAWIGSLAKDYKAYLLPVLTLFMLFLFLLPDVRGARFWMFSYLEKVERERLEVGKYIAKDAGENQKLLAWHGLLSRPFPGYVLDGTGLNSPLAVNYRLNRDSLIAGIDPDFGIHHGYEAIVESFQKAGYRINGLFGDVTMENWPAWIWWKKNEDTRFRYATLLIPDSSVTAGKLTKTEHPLKAEGGRIEIRIPHKHGETARLWFLYEGRNAITGRKLQIKLWRDSTLISEDFLPIPVYGDPQEPSLYTKGFCFEIPEFNDSLNLSVLRVEFLPWGADSSVKINNPILEKRITDITRNP
jgi:hypothetical protein